MGTDCFSDGPHRESAAGPEEIQTGKSGGFQSLPGTGEEPVYSECSPERTEVYDINEHYREYQWSWTYSLILDYYGLEEISEADLPRIREDYVKARRAWIAEIRKDAQKEFDMGDVEQEVFDDFISKLDHETDYED